MTEIIHVSTTRHEEWEGPKRYIRVYIYDTLDEFRLNYSPWWRDRDNRNDMLGAVGCFEPAPDKERHINGQWIKTHDRHWAGVMRLTKGWIDVQSVTHECVHAAAAIWRRDVAPKLYLGEDCGPNEEMLAYMVGDLSYGLYSKLYSEELV